MYVLIPIVILGLILIPFVMHSYVKVTDNDVVISRFCSLKAENHKYSEIAILAIAHIYKEGNGHACSITKYTIRFTDGTFWSIDDENLRGNRTTELAGAIPFISKKSGKPVKVIYE